MEMWWSRPEFYAYESGKAEAQFKPRLDAWHASYALLQRARAEALKINWLARLAESPRPGLRIFCGPLAAGEKVLADQRSSLSRLLAKIYSDALGVEMEGYGFLQAVEANHRHVHAIVVRGISDLISDKSVADASGWQEIAARRAAAFAF